MNINTIINQTYLASLVYNNLVGKNFLYVYNNQYIEVIFKVDEFKHLTGIGTSLTPKDFYKKIKKREINKKQIKFGGKNPKDLCELKLSKICDIEKITNSCVCIYSSYKTDSFTYRLALSNFEFVLCLSEYFDKNGIRIKNRYFVQSFRVDKNEGERALKKFNVDFIFEKSYTDKKYNKLLYGNKLNIVNLKPSIRSLISNDFILVKN